MTTVVPAIIPHTKSQMEEEFKKVSPFASLVQVDISDGVFTPIKTWPYNSRDRDFFEKLKTEEIGWPEWETVDVELHLMIKSPEEVLEDWIHTGIETVVAHIEATENFQAVIDLCRKHEVEIGLAIKPSTNISYIDPFVSQINFIQVMGSDMLGKHGVTLDNKAIELIKKLHTLYPQITIAIDIGVTPETENILVEAGASKLISGSTVLYSKDPEDSFHDLETQE